MKLSWEEHDQVSVLILGGDFVAGDVEAFRKSVRESFEGQTRDFVLEMSTLEFIDSAGLESLIWMQDLVAEQLGQVCLADVQEDVHTILEMTRLIARFERYADVEAAMAGLN